MSHWCDSVALQALAGLDGLRLQVSLSLFCAWAKHQAVVPRHLQGSAIMAYSFRSCIFRLVET